MAEQKLCFLARKCLCMHAHVLGVCVCVFMCARELMEAYCALRSYPLMMSHCLTTAKMLIALRITAIKFLLEIYVHRTIATNTQCDLVCLCLSVFFARSDHQRDNIQKLPIFVSKCKDPN